MRDLSIIVAFSRDHSIIVVPALLTRERRFIVPTFDTKVTEYLCSGWVFFFGQISTF